jgi:hypothetical protein
MATCDDFVQAQARALIQVIRYYKIDGGSAAAIWRDVEAFAHGASAQGADLQAIGRKHAGAAAAVFCGGVKLRAPNAALYLAFSAFARASQAYRFLDASRWIALYFAFMDKRAVAETALQNEVLERLETAMTVELARNCGEVAFSQATEVNGWSILAANESCSDEQGRRVSGAS